MAILSSSVCYSYGSRVPTDNFGVNLLGTSNLRILPLAFVMALDRPHNLSHMAPPIKRHTYA